MLEHNGKKITLENITLEDIEDIFEFDRDVMLQHRLKLGKEYVEKQFPENVEQTSRVKKILARNIELSDPKTFKDPKPALTYGKVFGDDPKDKKVKEIYLVDSQSVTEAESRVVKDFENSGVKIDYKVVGARESRILRVIE